MTLFLAICGCSVDYFHTFLNKLCLKLIEKDSWTLAYVCQILEFDESYLFETVMIHNLWFNSETLYKFFITRFLKNPSEKLNSDSESKINLDSDNKLIWQTKIYFDKNLFRQEYLLLEAKTAQQKIDSNFFREKIPFKLIQRRHATLLETFDSLLSKIKYRRVPYQIDTLNVLHVFFSTSTEFNM